MKNLGNIGEEKFELFNLCIGIFKDYFIVVNSNNYTLDLIPILDNNKLNFKIIEDDDNHNLEIDLERFLKNNR